MPARKQNKSCDECRRSRIGCDAHTTSGFPCSNCKRRGKTCSINWLTKREEIRGQTHRRRPSAPLRHHSDGLQDHTISAPANEGQIERRRHALRLHHALWEIFTTLFEPQLGLWIGNDCNPFKRMTTAPKTLVSRLMVTLDVVRSSLQVDAITSEMLRLPASSSSSGGHGEENDARINQALMSAVHAFSARWLPVDLFKKTGQAGEAARRRLMQMLWEQAHQNVLPILTLPSYRSILALYLFAITPSANSNQMQPVSQLCHETSLRHYLQLRLETRISISQPECLATDYDELNHLEDSAYWFGIVCDVSRSLLRCQPPILLAGPSSQARVWTMVSKQIDDFAIQCADMRFNTDVLSDTAVLKILQLGSSCKTMCWASITDVQDSLFYHRTILEMQTALSFALAKLQQFEAVFSPLLEQITRDFVLLSEKSQLGFVWLVLHFHLGVLILADSITAGTSRMMPAEDMSLTNHRLASVRAIVNVINLVCQYDNLNPQQSSLLLRDPYPDHASNALNRAAKTIARLAKTETITAAAATVLGSAVMQGLCIVSQISFTASQSLIDLTALFRENKIPLHTSSLPATVAVSGTASISLDSAVTPDMLENETLRELGQQAVADPSLVVKSIERHEFSGPGSTPDFGLDYLQFIDFTAVAGDWEFEDVFAIG